MKMNAAIDHLNTLAADSVKGDVPMRTTEEVLRFLKNPPKRDYSVPLEEATTAIVEIFGTADENDRRAITSKLNSHAQHSLLGYAGAMAVLAVRTQSPTLIDRGLIALVIEGGIQDWRDNIVALAKLYHSAVKLSMDVEKAFEAAARLADPGIIKDEINGFRRPPEERDLKAFYESEEMTEEGFRYKQVLPWLSSTGAAPNVMTPVETSLRISSSLNRDQQDALIRQAGSLAVTAVRTQSPKLVEAGLRSLALGGGASDSSHSVVALAKLYHAAVKLGMDTEKAFAEAAQFAPPGDLQTVMIGFPLRPPKERDLAAFNLQEDITENGFDYKQVVPEP
jgi:hypothetical protein